MDKNLYGFQWSTDITGRFTHIGVGLTEWIGDSQLSAISAQDLSFHPGDRPHFAAIFEAASTSRKEFTAHARLRRADGAWIWCSVHGWPCFSGFTLKGYDGVTIPVDLAPYFGVQLVRLPVCLGQQYRFRN